MYEFQAEEDWYGPVYRDRSDATTRHRPTDVAGPIRNTARFSVLAEAACSKTAPKTQRSPRRNDSKNGNRFCGCVNRITI